MTLAQGSAALATLLLVLVMLLHVCLAAGLPFGRAAWGGEHRVLPPKLRWGSLASCLPLAVAAWVILARVNLLATGAGSTAVRVATWAFAGLFALNTLGNLASRSPTERWLMTPTTLVLVGCFVTAALSQA